MASPLDDEDLIRRIGLDLVDGYDGSSSSRWKTAIRCRACPKGRTGSATRPINTAAERSNHRLQAYGRTRSPGRHSHCFASVTGSVNVAGSVTVIV